MKSKWIIKKQPLDDEPGACPSPPCRLPDVQVCAWVLLGMTACSWGPLGGDSKRHSERRVSPARALVASTWHGQGLYLWWRCFFRQLGGCSPLFWRRDLKRFFAHGERGGPKYSKAQIYGLMVQRLPDLLQQSRRSSSDEKRGKIWGPTCERGLLTSHPHGHAGPGRRRVGW